MYREVCKELARVDDGRPFSRSLPVVLFRPKALRLCAAFVLLVLAGAPARAQPAAVPDTMPKHAVQLWAGRSPGSVRLFGKIEDARFGAVGVRYLRVLSVSRGRVLAYTVDVLPMASMTYEPVVGAPEAAVRRGERTLRGVGITPAGLRVYDQTQSRWQPFMEGGVGFVYFTDPLPDRRGERFNFTLHVGAGVRVGVSPNAALTLGYRFHHLSNGFRGMINPGFDSNLFHLGTEVSF